MKTFTINHNNGFLSKQKLVIAYLLLSIVFGSCKKFVTIPPPQTKTVTSNVFNNDASATAALTTIYTQMWQQSLSGSLSLNLGVQSDELQNYSTATGIIRLYTNSLTATTDDGFWTAGYSYIYQANEVIEGLQQYSGTSTGVKQQLMGEAYFIRAFTHFYLTNMYGAVPIVLTTNYATNNTISRSPRLQVLQQVVNDLLQAENLLNVNYVDASDTTMTSERARPNKAVAAAMLARAYLYLGDYDSKNVSDYANAEKWTNTLINNTLYSLSPYTGTTSAFMKSSSEAIWQIETPLPAPSTADTFDGYEFILQASPATSATYKCTTVSQQLLNSFEANDLRKVNWIGSYTTTGTSPVTYYFPYKYKNVTYKGQEYVTALRLAEQFLIRAEARVDQGNIQGGLQDLNVIRNHAGLANYSGAQDQASVLNAILHERQVELFAEWGHRWFDLNRTGNVNTVMTAVCPLKGATWNANNYQSLYPIPQSEILLNNNLTQNTGY